jgi:carbon starvation protein
VWGGQYAHGHPDWAKIFTLREIDLAWTIIIYGLAASILPVWLLLAPRDYLSTFMKLGTIFALAFGVFVVLPDLKFPAVSKFVDGSGPVVAGKLFPFCFITIACGAISGFHTLIASGTTPKLITRETYARPIGYGAMCLESLVATMALIAACTLEPGIYLSMNIKGAPATTVAKVTALGFPISVETMDQQAQMTGEKTLFGRTGGAATLAVGMANIFSKTTGGRWLDLWYHFAIMFEALFILTTLDAGTRVGRYLLQDVLGNLWKPLSDVKNLKANVFASVLIVAAWGYFLIQGVRDPEGGIKALWPLFGIANQLLASIALCLATTIILKMQLAPAQASGTPAQPESGPPPPPGRPIFALVTLLPLLWLLSVTMTAGVQKIFHSKPAIGFLAKANQLDGEWAALESQANAAHAAGNTLALTAARKAVTANRIDHFNNLVDATAAGIFILLVSAIFLLSVREWILLLARQRLARLHESEPVWLPDYALAEGKPLRWLNLFALALALAKELSGEAQLERARQQSAACCDPTHRVHEPDDQPAAATQRRTGQLYVQVAERRFNGVNRCC